MDHFESRFTAEDRQTIEKWRWALTAVYSTILVFLVLFVAAGPYTKIAENDKRMSVIPGNIFEVDGRVVARP